MKAMIITKTDLQRARIETFESIEEMKQAGYSDRNFRADFHTDFVVMDQIKDELKKKTFILDDKKKE